MENQNIYNVEKLEFRQIVLQHIQKVLEISSAELRNKKTYIKGVQGGIQLFSEEDTRYSYVQAIENLAYILMPYFDKQMQRVYDECILVINAYDFEIENSYKEEIKLFLKEFEKEPTRETNKIKKYCLDKKIEYAKILFIELNKLLNRNDYLKSAVYGEDKDELISDDDSEGGEE